VQGRDPGIEQAISLMHAGSLHHDQNQNSFYFITFTCYKWLHLFKEANTYDTVYKWFHHLYNNRIYVTGYVIMPNHVHVLLYFPQMPGSLNSIVGNAKRFMAYEIIKRLEEKKENNYSICCMAA
jgi:REP element-mobilizing transposase RayT